MVLSTLQCCETLTIICLSGFYFPKLKLCPHETLKPHFPPYLWPLASTNALSDSMNLPILGILYKWIGV